MTMIASLELEKDTVLEVNYCRVAPDDRSSFFVDYKASFDKVAGRYGGRLLGSLDVFACTMAPDDVNLAFYTAWPEQDAVRRFLEDDDSRKLHTMAAASLPYMNGGHFFECASDQTIALDDERIYELWLLWKRVFSSESEQQAAATAAQQYISIIGDVAETEYGRAGLCWLQPPDLPAAMNDAVQAAYQTPTHSQKAHGGGMDQWRSVDDYLAWFDCPVHKENVHLRNEYLEKFNAYQARIHTGLLGEGNGFWS